MKFGIFYEVQLARPWLPGGEWALYQNALDQVELADRLGYDYAWEVEHHFLEEYSHSPAPEVFLTELQPFGVAFDEKRAIWEEAIRAIIPMFRDGGCEHHGKYFDMPLRNVAPTPVQKPLPPL